MDTVDPSRFIFSFILVLGLIGLMYVGLKYLSASGKFTGMNAKIGEGRIEILETRYIDAKRRLVLIKCDNTQHLLLLADGRETVIESSPMLSSGLTCGSQAPYSIVPDHRVKPEDDKKESA